MPPCDFLYLLCVFLYLRGFNPCFSGCRPATTTEYDNSRNLRGFNPCFSGCRPATMSLCNIHRSIYPVSILVLVDAALRR